MFELGEKIPVLDHGYVIPVAILGTDKDVVDAARVSYGEGTKQMKDDDALIDYLMRHHHDSPFEMPVLRFEIKLPVFAERQWSRHRINSWNEVSARYSVLPDETYIPSEEHVKKQSTTNKQGSGNDLDISRIQAFTSNLEENNRRTYEAYNSAIKDGVARETARLVLPVNIYTKKVWQANLRSLLHFLKLRTDAHAQQEIRMYATVLSNIVAFYFPVIYKSWQNHIQKSVTFSADEWCLIKPFLYETRSAIDNCNLTNSRKQELLTKIFGA